MICPGFALRTLSIEAYDADFEPWLGASDSFDHTAAWSLANNTLDDREDENEHAEGDGFGQDCVDDEPSLGSLDGRISQKRWGLPDR